MYRWIQNLGRACRLKATMMIRQQKWGGSISETPVEDRRPDSPFCRFWRLWGCGLQWNGNITNSRRSGGSSGTW
jgi:hypothetical protein